MGTVDPPDKTKSMSEPKFLIMKRTDDSSMANISPFLIKKTIDFTCNGEVLMAKKTRDGNLLIKTKNLLQALKLKKLQLLGPFPVEVREHSTLNTSKGVIYSNDLRYLPENVIKDELATQNVIEVKKILKKVNNELEETGLIILTFDSHITPENIKIGYEVVKVRTFIPAPLRCNNCFRFGHITTLCRNKKSCINCAKEYHMDPNTKELCNFNKCCVNCKDLNLPDTNHSSVFRRCPIFVKHQEIQAIKTLEKVDIKKATSIYNSRHPHDGSLYSSVAKTNSTDYNKHPQNNAAPNHSTTTRKILSYEELAGNNEESKTSNIILSHSTNKLPTSPSPSVKILPKNISNRLKSQLKAKDKKQQKTNNVIDLKTSHKEKIPDLSSSDEQMDLSNLEDEIN